MELQAQCYYLTRNGQTVFIDAIASGNPFTTEVPSHPAVGYIGPATCCWRLDGSLTDEESDFDLVSVSEDFVTEILYALEDLDTGEQSEARFTTHRAAFEACMPGWQVIEMMNVIKV